MTTITITRRKEPIGFISKMTITSKDGHSVSLKAGETATLKTNAPIDELFVKHLWGSQTVKTEIPVNGASNEVNLELFHNLSRVTMYIILVISAMLVYTALSGFSSKRYISISLFLILIALVAKLRQGSLTFKQL